MYNYYYIYYSKFLAWVAYKEKTNRKWKTFLRNLTADKKKGKPEMLFFFSPFFHGKNTNPDLVVWDSTRLIVQCVLKKPKI